MIKQVRDLGDSFSRYNNITFFSAKTPEDLQLILGQLRMSFELLGIYFANGRHIAWIAPDHKVIKKIKEKKEITNG